MKGTVKVKDNSDYRYKGLTLKILGIYSVHMDEICHDIYPLGSVTYKLSLEGTEWDDQSYTVIHDSHLEDIKSDGTVEANVWYDRLKDNGQEVINNLFNPKGDKSFDEVYDAYLKQANLERTHKDGKRFKSSNELKVGEDAFFRKDVERQGKPDVDYQPIVIEQADIDQIAKYKGTAFEDYWYIAKQKV